MNQTLFRRIFRTSNLSRRFTIITIMFFGVILGLLGYTITTLHKDQSIACLIDVAGRQRMLLQKHMNEVFLVSHGIAADYPSTRKLIRTTFITLMEGGSVVLNHETGQRKTVPAAPTDELLNEWGNQLTHFDQFVERTDTFLKLGSDHLEFREQAQALLDQNTALVGLADKAVQHLDAYSESNIATMLKWEIMIALAIGLVGVVVTNQGIRAGRKLENEISERKHAESELRNSELFLNSIIENIPYMIFVKDAKDLRFLRLNDAGEKLLGYPKEAMIGKTDYDFFPESEAAFYGTKDREVLSAKILLDIPEETIQTKSHGARYLHTKKIPILDEHGLPQYLLGISEDITEQKQAALESRERELLLSLIFEIGPECIKRVAVDGTLLTMNPAGLALIEADGENEALGLSVFDLVVPEHVGAFKHMHQNVLQGKPQTLQFEVQGLKGGRRWMETYAVPFSNPLTKEVEQLAVTHDITERKTSEERANQLSRQNELILSSAGDGIYGLNLQGQATFINPAGAQMLGYAPKEIIGRSMHAAIHHTKPDGSSYPQEECPMYRAFTDGTIHKVENEVLWRKDGTSVPVEYSSTPIWQEGHLAGTVVTFRDISERKQAEITLRATEQMYRQILDSISDMVFMKDQNFRLLWANKAFRAYYNMTNEELKGILDSPINEPEFTKAYNEADAYVLSTGKIFDIPEEPVTRHDKNIHLFHTIKAPLYSENGEVTKLVGVSRDITERKKSEKALEALAKDADTLGNQNFFENLVHQLATALQVPMVFLAERVEETFPNVHGLVFWHGDHFESNFEYDCLAGPCEKVFEGTPVYISQRVQELFPENPTVKALNLESYCGTPLFNSKGAVVGNLAIMDQKPLSLNAQDQSLVKIFAARAGAELERKRAQGALLESEERYRVLYEDNPSMYFTVAQNGTILSVNQFGAQQLGYSVEELVGIPVLDLFLEEEKSLVQERFETCLRNPLDLFSWEFRKVRKDKSIVWVKEAARAVRNRSGEIEVLIVCEDISERKETEKSLQEWKALTESVLGQLPKGFAYRCLNNKNWTAVYVSDGIEEVTGFPASDLLSGKINYDSLLALGENERVWSNVQDALAKHLPYENEHQVVTRDGKKKWILARGRFIYDDAGQLLYLDGLNVDITEYKQIQNELRTSETRFRSLVEHMPFCVHEIDIHGKITSMNKAGHTMVAIENESQIIGQSYLVLVEEKDYARVRDYFEQALQGRPVDFEFDVTKQGHTQIFTKSFIPIQRRDGKVEKIVGIAVDITERKHAERRLRESEAKRIEALRQSDALKSALLSSVSHELRTPLTAMKGSVSSIIGNGPSTMNLEQQDFLKGIDTEINYMSHLVDNLLDMSQIEAGTLIPHKEWHPLEDLLEGALRRTEQTIGTRNIDIHIPEDAPPIFVDAIEIQQVFINLLDNAVKYSAPSSPIRIRAEMEAHQILVRVSNIGEPIQPQDLERIFERFYRRPPPRKQPIRGTGLGLAICKGVVEAHGGHIWADSIGQEVTIAFTIPITQSMPHFSLEGRHKSKLE
jgi:PAS domain S-box-containing protein